VTIPFLWILVLIAVLLALVYLVKKNVPSKTLIVVGKTCVSIFPLNVPQILHPPPYPLPCLIKVVMAIQTIPPGAKPILKEVTVLMVFLILIVVVGVVRQNLLSKLPVN